jgi:hypothetical protein
MLNIDLPDSVVSEIAHASPTTLHEGLLLWVPATNIATLLLFTRSDVTCPLLHPDIAGGAANTMTSAIEIFFIVSVPLDEPNVLPKAARAAHGPCKPVRTLMARARSLGVR